FIYRNHGNILHLDQYVDRERRVFFMRVEWELANFSIDQHEIGNAFHLVVGKQFSMEWFLHFSDEVQRMAIFVSKYEHCLYDILSRWRIGELPAEIPLIISNHP